jgi:hypothetical protein
MTNFNEEFDKEFDKELFTPENGEEILIDVKSKKLKQFFLFHLIKINFNLFDIPKRKIYLLFIIMSYANNNSECDCLLG